MAARPSSIIAWVAIGLIALLIHSFLWFGFWTVMLTGVGPTKPYLEQNHNSDPMVHLGGALLVVFLAWCTYKLVNDLKLAMIILFASSIFAIGWHLIV